MRQIYLVLVLLLASAVGQAQDPVYSQFFSSPTLLNPAFTGLFPGRYRIALNHRSQWPQLLSTPYSTSAFAADFHYDLDPKRRDTDGFGAGVVFLNDRLPEVGYASNQAMISGAFHKTLDARGERTLSLGGQVGIIQRNVGYGELSFEDEFNGTTGYIAGAGGELLPENNVAFADYQLGLNYSSLPSRGVGVFTGVAVHHVGAPEQSFYAEATAGDEIEVTNTLHRRYSAYLNLRLRRTGSVEISPRAYFLSQGPHATLHAGSNVRLLVNYVTGTSVHLGSWLRMASSSGGFGPDSVVGLVGLEVSDFVFGLSYDVGINPKVVRAQHRGAFELSISYLGLGEDDGAVPCPKF
ncbi:PorP/SprF family type IX secretion system membrane protein [Lewinella sp. JB7]|uniref:PorP/SprF family type IX secretion system membrane protein n=1 Tax=Lewinella sp. JB7 TaxID=2962887 RepID=UPI0020C948B4|nr:PorP/SprF family type IX secretion system membrane protein [Lewinella sp. JB7]MCP9235098.1 PorP/SprF family type IX secretion system membrane protein [Lewinella sp. JB7]